MNVLFDATLCSQWVLTLGHFLWQGLAIGGLAWLVAMGLRSATSAVRYRVYLSALVVMIWFISRRIRREREHCCDDLVVATGGDRLGYASSLLDIARGAAGQRRPTLAALAALRADGRPSELGGRIRRLLGAEHHDPIRLNRPGLVLTAVSLVALTAVGLLRVNGQEESAPEAPSTVAQAKLPNGVVVELVGVGFHPSKDRPWWKPDGTQLETRPYEESGGTVMPGSPEQAECREFRIEIRGLPRDHAVRTDYGPVSAATGSSYEEGLWVGDHAAGPFKLPTASIRIGLATEPLGPAQIFDARGRKQEPLDATAELTRLYEQVVAQDVQESKGRTELIFDAVQINALRNQADWQIYAIDVDGKRQRSTFSSTTPANELRLGFPIPLAAIDHFEYRLRPYRYGVTFHNVALQPDQQTEVEVEVDAPDQVSLNELAEIIASRVAVRLPFTSDKHRQQTAAEFRELVQKYGAEQPETQFVQSILVALDRHLKQDFPEGPHVKDFDLRDRYYIRLPAEIRMLQWRLFMALRQRPLSGAAQQRLAQQIQWMREHIRSLPPPPDAFVRDGHTHDSVLAELQVEIHDPLNPLFQDPLSDEQFAMFKKRIEEDRERSGDRALMFAGPHTIWANMKTRYRQAAEIPVPELATFAERPISYGQANGRLSIGFPSSERFRGMQNTVSDDRQRSSINVIDLSESLPTTRSFVDGVPKQGATLDELDRWFSEKAVRGHLIFDEQEMQLIGVRGTRLVPLKERRFVAVDGVPKERLIEQVEKDGSRFWRLPESVSRDDTIGKIRYDAMAAVLTPKSLVFIFQVQQHDAAGLQFHIRQHHPRSDSSGSVSSPDAAKGESLASGTVHEREPARGSILGRIVFDGELDDPVLTRYRADLPVYGPISIDDSTRGLRPAVIATVPNEALLIDKQTGGVKNAFVYLADKPEQLRHASAEVTPPPPAQVLYREYRFTPRALVLEVGRPVELSAEKDVTNFSARLFNNQSFNRAVGPGESISWIAERSEALPFPVKSDLHPSAKSWWLVVDHPYAAVTAADGSFQLENLPAGEHKLNVWHEAVGFVAKKLSVTVPAGQSVHLATQTITVDQLRETKPAGAEGDNQQR